MRWIDLFDTYQISTSGEIRSKSKPYPSAKKGKIIAQNLNSCGYPIINLNSPKRKTFAVHRLVAKAFLVNHNNKNCINHIDGNKLNNNVSNLEWCDYSHNIKHAYIKGLKSRYGLKRILLTHETGIFYESIKEAADSIGAKRHYLDIRISGSIKNRSPFIVV